MVAAGRVMRAGLVATNSIRQGVNRQVLRRVLDDARIFEAWADEPWVNKGATVRVSLVAFGHSVQPARLDGGDVASIFADLSAQAEGSIAMDLTTAAALRQNESTSFFGFCLAGPFVVDAGQARAWLQLPNPNGRSNADVLSPIWNGADVTRRAADRWTVDFGAEMSVDDAALYEQPFAHALREVHPIRMANQRASRSRYWWRHGETRPGLRRAGANAARWIVTSETAKHRCFVWLPGGVAPEHKLVVIPREDDVTLGVLSSRAHLLWASHLGSTLEDRPVYTTSACFATFPFPAGLTPADTAHQRTEALPGGALVPADLAPETRARSTPIAQAAKRLTDLRDAWLNPPEWCQRVAEVTPLGRATSPYPDRIVARPGHEKALAQRTLTQLYNQRPAWLAQAHAALDAAVAAAYGWPGPAADLPDDDILRRLLALNRQRSA